jgi:hypothetical protein
MVLIAFVLRCCCSFFSLRHDSKCSPFDKLDDADREQVEAAMHSDDIGIRVGTAAAVDNHSKLVPYGSYLHRGDGKWHVLKDTEALAVGESC